MQLEARFSLTCNQAARMVNRHADQVITYLEKQNGKPLHEIPMSAILPHTGAFLSKHPNFKLHERYEAFCHPFVREAPTQEAYCQTEIPHRVYVRRMSGQLVAEKRMSEEDVPLFNQLLGSIQYNASDGVKRKQLKALTAWTKKRGVETVDAILQRALEIHFETLRQLGELNNEFKKPDVAALGDGWHNGQHNNLTHARQGPIPLKAKHVEEWIKIMLNPPQTNLDYPAHKPR